MTCYECQAPGAMIHVTSVVSGARTTKNYCPGCASAADLPGIDHHLASIAFFEGTLLPVLQDMADRGASWRAIASVAFRRGIQFEAGTIPTPGVGS